ncbi:thioredoxin domain-containing protein [Arthrobacter sp.]|uniref:DsbA family protein n=1 Tax=Arthrobacter sp. TaxID=1667 RepID=UPI0026DFB8CD|nr:thioredoxin domain-containing protein [Arthrobacter sp.]MDO5751950.1 thioredoxin domain-containing protein [Arthrobacter sp.]
MKTKKSRNILLALVLGVVVVLAVVFVGAAAQKTRLDEADAPAASAASAEPAAALNLEHRTANDPVAMGAVDAPVVMIEYSDYRCPFCGVYARKTQPEIIKKYVDTGQLRIEWRDLPVLGGTSMNAAVAARAAGEQGLFWQFNEAVYAAAPEKGKADLSEQALLGFAQQIGIPDMAKFTVDMNSPELTAKVQADLSEGSQLGVNSTPTFVINNEAIPGAQPMEIFSQVIDAALAQAK